MMSAAAESNTPLRVLHAISSVDTRYGGPSIALQGLVAAQIAEGHRIIVLVTPIAEDDPEAIEVLQELGAEVVAVGPASGPLRRAKGLAAAAEQSVRDADIVHAHAIWEEAQYQACRAARRAGKPWVVRPCGMLDPWSLAQGKWKKRLYLAWRLKKMLRHASAIHCTTPIERDLLAPLGLNVPMIIEPNGVDFAEFDNMPPAGSFRAQFPALQGRPLLLFLSRIHYKKGLDVLVDALSKMRRTDAALVIVGPDNDNYQPQVERLVKAAGLSDRVVFAGMRKGVDRVAAYADADLFVLPSRQENFGIVVAEALAAGTPVVISDQVNLHPEITEAGVGGVTPLDAAAFAAEVDRWLDDDARRRNAGERAKMFAQERYAWPAIAARWSEHYERFLPGAHG